MCGQSKCVKSHNHLCLYWQLVHADIHLSDACFTYLYIPLLVLINLVKSFEAHKWQNDIIKMNRIDAQYSPNHMTKQHLSRCRVSGSSIIIINVIWVQSFLHSCCYTLYSCSPIFPHHSFKCKSFKLNLKSFWSIWYISSGQNKMSIV